MKKIYILLLFLIVCTSLKSQIDLHTTYDGTQTYDVKNPLSITMSHGFNYKPQASNSFWAHIDPYMIVPPSGGETGGPGGSIGADGIVGATQGSLAVSDIGNLLYSIPIKCIPGIAGMQLVK